MKSEVAAVKPVTTGGSETVGPSGGAISKNRKIRWRWGLLAAVAMAFLSLYPQIDLWVTRGADWKGSFALLSYDEEVYAAYINGLVLGRPRRTEPLEIPNPGKPQHESLFSIQFVPAYCIALPTRAFGLTVAESFILLTLLMAYVSTLILFYLLASVTRDELFAAAAALAVLILGTLAARHSVAMGWFGRNWYGSFLFLRRYVHAFAFPIFLGFILLTRRALIEPDRQARRAALASGVLFAVLVFSYFFLWTAALAWLFCLVLIWLVARRSEWLLVVKRVAPTVLFAVSALTVYAFMFWQRNSVTERRWLALNFTRTPDLYRAPEWIGAVTIGLLIWTVKKGRAELREPLVLFACSLALMPFVAFNQQIVTGRSLEPVHYEMFSANYLSLLAFAFTLFVLWRGRQVDGESHFPRRPIALVACLVIAWGVVEMTGVTLQSKDRNVARDLFMPVTKRLSALAAEHGKGINEREVVFSPNILLISDNIAAAAPQTPFWGTHVPLFAGLSSEEQQQRYFQYLYYTGVSPETLRIAFENNDMLQVGSAFGYFRYNPTLSANFHPITIGEIEDKVREYRDYIATFDHERARQTQISYVVLGVRSNFDFANLDKWYVRDAGEDIGPFILYQVRLR